MKRFAVITGVFAIAAWVAAAQDVIQLKKLADAKAKAELGDVLQKVQIIGLEGGIMSNVTGAPYSAEQVREHTQTLGDGTRIHTENTVKLYRDGQGRVRRETPEMISIYDPVAGVGYTLNPKTMTGSKMHVSVSTKTGPNSVSWTATASSSDGHTVQMINGTKTETHTVVGSGEGKGAGVGVATIVPDGNIGYAFSTITGDKTVVFNKNANAESLGTEMKEGVNATGERRTETIAAGQIGNDRPIQVVNEHWYSPDLQMDIMTTHIDPRSGEDTMRVINIQRGEPDPSLFAPSAGYQILDHAVPLPAFKRDQ